MLRRTLRKIMWVALFCLSAFVSMFLGGEYLLATHPRTQRYPVGAEIPQSFPVLVVSSGEDSSDYKARIVQHWALKDYLRSVQSYSFLVPKSKEAELNKQLDAMTWNDVWKSQYRFGLGGFTVTALPGGKQMFRVEGAGDDDRINTGWYIADSHSFTPKYHRHFFGPTIYGVGGIAGGLVNLLAWLIGRHLIRLMKRRSRAPLPAQ